MTSGTIAGAGRSSGPSNRRHYGSVITLLLPSVTAPIRVKARPSSVTLSFSVMLDTARMLPCHADPTPIVAAAALTQNTFLACALLIRMMFPTPVSELPAWKTNCLLYTSDAADDLLC